ncbi:unnamed protein product [Rotaria sp. Silwood2]|nr:unnamed protein product [Rotaria sp. Silwood2]CAF2963629.1 unnamed protein product [Rotaria sp. Silwood2]CAF3956039.1 unnamed protein product [Rotaria sp. Silwood2]
MLQAHNNYRVQHCVPRLVLNDDLSRSAQSYAEYLVKSGTLAHSDNRNDIGENLYKAYNSKCLKQMNGKTRYTI